MSRPTRAAAVAALASLALAASPAPAQPTGDASAIAEGLFQQARDLVKQGRYDQACPKLAESQRLDPKLGTLLNLAVCHEKQGRTASAWAEYTSAAAIARRDGQREREDFARKQVAALEKKLPRLILQVNAPAPGLSITIDDQPMSAAVLGAPLPIDPGRHRVGATAPGKIAWSRDVEVPAQHGEILVPIPALEAAVPGAPSSSLPTPPVPVEPAPALPGAAVLPPTPQGARPEPAPAPLSTTPTILMGAGFAVGGLGFVVGAIAGGVTLANTSSIRGHCNANNVCPSGQQGAIDSANTLANVANATLAIGAAGVVVGVVGVVMRAQAPKSAWTLTPLVGPAVAGLRGTF